jgi:hypothetical protein
MVDWKIEKGAFSFNKKLMLQKSKYYLNPLSG